MTNIYAQIIEYDEMNNTVPPGLWMMCCQKSYQNTVPLALKIGTEKAHIKNPVEALRYE